MFGYFWGGVFIALPLFLKLGFTAAGPRYSHEVFLILCCLLSLMLFNSRANLIAKAMMIICSLMVFFNASDFTSVPYFSQMAIIIPCLAVFAQFSGETDDEMIKNGIAISAILQSIFAIINMQGIDIFATFYGAKQGAVHYLINGGVGTLGNKNVLGSFLAMALPVFFRKKWIYATPLILVGIYLSESMTPLIVVGAVLISYFFPKIKMTFGLVPIFAMALAKYIVVSGLIVNHRTQIWEKIINKAGGSEFFGWGTGFINNNALAWVVDKVPAIQAHNEYIELFFTYGIFGTILVSLILHLRENNDKIKTSIICGGLASAFTHFNLHIPITALLFGYALFFNYSGEKCAGNVKTS